MSRKIFITVNSTWNLATFRSGLIRDLVLRGYDVVAAAPPDEHVGRVTALGCRHVGITIDSFGTHPLRDFKLLLTYWRLLRNERPDAVLAFTIKPNVYGSLAAHMLAIPVINNIAGLGTTFLRSAWLNRVAMVLYSVALRRSRFVCFQNRDDRLLFSRLRLVRHNQAVQLPGSGVDTEYFMPRTNDSLNGRPFRFLLLGRLLWDKGVGEFIDAVTKLHRNGLKVEAQLLGFLDANNPASISQEQLASWISRAYVQYLGSTEDVRPFLAKADCVVLPSYREGTPRALLEAASMAKPIITTDTPGCRDVIINNVSGYLVHPRDTEGLELAMQRMLDLSQDARERMGQSGRAHVAERFQERSVIATYRDLIAACMV